MQCLCVSSFMEFFCGEEGRGQYEDIAFVGEDGRGRDARAAGEEGLRPWESAKSKAKAAQTRSAQTAVQLWP